jgi:hypothetical protein
MIRYSRRTLLKTGAAFAGVSALGCPAIVRAQAAKIKIGHLTPLTGFLGAIGSYAQLGVKMAAEEINASGGIMGKQIDLMSEDSVNPATASTKAQRMIEQDGAVLLFGEISSASSLTIMQVAERNKKVFFSTGARSDALRGKDCNRYSFHCDIPNTVMVNAVGTALNQKGMVKGKKFVTLTADYIFGHDLLKAAKAFFSANDATLIGDELIQPVSAESPAGQARRRMLQPRRQPGHQPRQAICRVRPALPAGRFQPQHRRRLGDGRRQSQRHLADGLVSHARQSRLEGLRRELHQEARQAAGKPRLDRIHHAENDRAGDH